MRISCNRARLASTHSLEIDTINNIYSISRLLECKHNSRLFYFHLGICEKGGLTYENGEKLEDGCDSVCTCMNGKMDCTARCTGPFFKKGKKIDDPLCTAKTAEDPCCSVLVCAGDTGD